MSVVSRKVAGAARAKENPHCDGPACGCQGGPAIECQGSIVQGSALARPLSNPPIQIVLTDCRPPALVTCPSHSFFEIDPDTRLIFFYDFSTCAFEADPSPGGCPTSYAQPFAIQAEDGSYDFYVCLPDGTYLIEQGGSGAPPTFTLVECPPASCKKFPLVWDGVTLVFSGPLTISDLDVSAPLTNC